MKHLFFVALIGCCVSALTQCGMAESSGDTISPLSYVDDIQEGQRVIYGTVYEDDPRVDTRNFDKEKDPLLHRTLFLHESIDYPTGQYYKTIPVIYQTVPHAYGILKNLDGKTVARFETNDDGHFLLYDIPEGIYDIYIEERATGRTGGGRSELVYKDERAYLLAHLHQDGVVDYQPVANEPMMSYGSAMGGLPLALLGLLGLTGIESPRPVSPSLPR